MYAESVLGIRAQWAAYTRLAAATDDETQLQTQFENARHHWQAVSTDALKTLAEDSAASRRDAIDITMTE